MPGKNSKQTAAKTETPVEVKTETPVEAAPVVAQKGGKKAAAPQKVEAAPVATTPAQKGGKKAAAPQKVEAAPAAVPAQKGGKKAATPKVEAPAQKAGAKKAAAPKATVAKKAAAPKPKAEKPAKVAKKVAADEEAEEGEETGDRRIRSFKVRLPGKEDYEGRFTGLTPYQAANKALSKYFRETKSPKSEITFSICESTRKSKKGTYTYVGKRQKLDTPVSYKIQDGREIVKNFKNSLKKVKKAESSSESA